MCKSARLAFGLLAGTLITAALCSCGEATGRPLIQSDPGADAGDGGAGTGVSTDPPPPPDDGQLATGPVYGLCDSCDDSGDCGDGNDYCVRYRESGERRCARDCSEGRGCPAGYECVGLVNSSATQCVPEQRSCEHRASIGAPPRLAELRAAGLELVNQERQRLALPLLMADECLNEIAQTSSRELALNGQRAVKFTRECASELPNCACGWAAEYQLSVAEHALVWTQALTFAIDQGMLANVNGAEPALASTSYTRAGIGVLLGGDEAWISFALGY